MFKLLEKKKDAISVPRELDNGVCFTEAAPVGQLEEQAEKKIDPAVYKYVNGEIVKVGAEDGNTQGIHTAREKNYAEWRDRYGILV